MSTLALVKTQHDMSIRLVTVMMMSMFHLAVVSLRFRASLVAKRRELFVVFRRVGQRYRLGSRGHDNLSTTPVDRQTRPDDDRLVIFSYFHFQTADDPGAG